jgi:hypothetical protein
MKSCVRLCNCAYMLLITEYNGDVSPDNHKLRHGRYGYYNVDRFLAEIKRVYSTYNHTHTHTYIQTPNLDIFDPNHQVFVICVWVHSARAVSYLDIPQDSNLIAETCSRVQVCVRYLMSVTCTCWYTCITADAADS